MAPAPRIPAPPPVSESTPEPPPLLSLAGRAEHISENHFQITGICGNFLSNRPVPTLASSCYLKSLPSSRSGGEKDLDFTWQNCRTWHSGRAYCISEAQVTRGLGWEPHDGESVCPLCHGDVSRDKQFQENRHHVKLWIQI